MYGTIRGAPSFYPEVVKTLKVDNGLIKVVTHHKLSLLFEINA